MCSNTEALEIDLEGFSKTELIHIITYAHEREMTFNQAIVDLLTKALSYFEKEKNISTDS